MSVAPADLTSTNAVTTDLIYDWNEVKRRGNVFPKKVELSDAAHRLPTTVEACGGCAPMAPAAPWRRRA